MLGKIKGWFEDKCPVCEDKLQAVSNTACTTKSCPQGHYKVETYCTLGVTIVYDGLK
ncbi:hypothetical protein [Paenibacillus glycanilyticus]|uniref:hypothetical protein n=1 Tax=Paenibacillus glycanilyticus TaxID=126569 RepID=UPI001910B75D|nr:hypothetical protein [Paenibacillus glycanilyticus]